MRNRMMWIVRSSLVMSLISLNASIPTSALAQVWEPLAGVPAGDRVQDILPVSDSDILVALRTDGVRRSSDRGTTWRSVNDGLEGTDVIRIGRTGAGDFLVSAIGSPGGVFRLQSSGTWKRTDLPAAPVGLVLNRRNEVIAYAQSSIFRSTDGDHFTRVVQVNTGLGQVLALAPDGRLYVGTEGVGVFRSSDDGDTWERIGDKVNGAAFGFGVHGDVLYAERAAVWRYSGGTTWVRSDTGLPNSPRIFSFATNTANQIFGGTTGGAVYVSNDDGRNWQPYGSGLPSTFAAGTLKLDPSGFLYAGSGEGSGGLYRTSLSTVTKAPPARPATPLNPRIAR